MANRRRNQTNTRPQKPNQQVAQKSSYLVAQVQKLDSRTFSKEAHQALNDMITEFPEVEKNKYYLEKSYHKKASALIQGLTAYISTWGLHRLSGDAQNFLQKTSEDTKYKGKVYLKFLESLKSFSKMDFDVDNEGSLIHLPLRQYTALNRLAIKLAKEWAFWAPSVLGEAEDGQ